MISFPCRLNILKAMSTPHGWIVETPSFGTDKPTIIYPFSGSHRTLSPMGFSLLCAEGLHHIYMHQGSFYSTEGTLTPHIEEAWMFDPVTTFGFVPGNELNNTLTIQDLEGNTSKLVPSQDTIVESHFSHDGTNIFVRTTREIIIIDNPLI